MSKSPSRKVHVLLTCEHGGNQVPAEYRALFQGARDVLASHRGWDPGALELAKRFAGALDASLHASTTSRLLIELNRSRHHPRLFSQFTRGLSREAKTRLIAEHYTPYRSAVEAHIAKQVAAGGRVLHISVHSFTPVLDGEVRQAEIGLLYDPSRTAERSFCHAWRRQIIALDRTLRVRKNYPYLGTSDGFTTHLRKRFKNTEYAGVELEVNQRFPLGDAKTWKALQRTLIESLEQTLAESPPARRTGS